MTATQQPKKSTPAKATPAAKKAPAKKTPAKPEQPSDEGYASHHDSYLFSIEMAVGSRDFPKVEQVFNEYGDFLTRYPEALLTA